MSKVNREGEEKVAILLFTMSTISLFEEMMESKHILYYTRHFFVWIEAV